MVIESDAARIDHLLAEKRTEIWVRLLDFKPSRCRLLAKVEHRRFDCYHRRAPDDSPLA